VRRTVVGLYPLAGPLYPADGSVPRATVRSGGTLSPISNGMCVAGPS
jgi:hypothetical protein